MENRQIINETKIPSTQLYRNPNIFSLDFSSNKFQEINEGNYINEDNFSLFIKNNCAH
jgi:hypothetical protein